MASRAIVAAAAVLAAACSAVPNTPDGGDAGPPDLGPVPCLTTDSPTPAEMTACGICVESYARFVGPLGTAPVGRAAAVPGGVVLALAGGAAFVSTDGTIAPLSEEPVSRMPLPPGYLLRNRLAVAVPGANRVWIVTDYGTGSPSHPVASDVVLYAVSSAGWMRLADGRGPWVDVDGRAFALPTGQLIGAPFDVADPLPSGAVRFRPNTDGTVDVKVVTPSDLGFPPTTATYTQVEFGWPLVDGTAAVVLRGGNDSFTSEMVIVDADLHVVRSIGEVGWPSGPAAYEPGYAPYVFDVRVHRDGSATLALAGTQIGSGGAPWSQYWLLRVSPSGMLLTGAPGTLVNADHYTMATDLVPGGGTFSALALMFPGRSAVVWSEYVQGSLRPGLGDWSAELDEATGAVVAGGSRALPMAHAFVSMFTSRLWAWDGEDVAYLGEAEYRTPSMPMDHQNNYFVNRVNADFTLAWSAPVMFQTCGDRVGNDDALWVGADGDGVWTVWGDYETDNNGAPELITKVALVRSDGTFAWGG